MTVPERPAVEEGKGDGDLCAKCGLPPYVSELQHHHPPNEGGCVGCLDHTFAARPLVHKDDDYCDTCDDEGWIVNDVDDSGPWRVCPHCNESGNKPSPFRFVAAADDPRDEDDDVQAAWDNYNDKVVDWADLNRPAAVRDFDALVDARKRVEAAIERRRGVARDGDDDVEAARKVLITKALHSWSTYDLTTAIKDYELVVRDNERRRGVAVPQAGDDVDGLTLEELIRVRIFGIREKQRRHGYDVQHDREHVANEPHVCIGLVAQYMAAGQWDDAAAMAQAFAEAAYLNEQEANRG